MYLANTAEKWLWLEKPAFLATVARGSPFFMRTTAASTRARSTYWYGEVPVVIRKSFMKCGLLKPVDAARASTVMSAPIVSLMYSSIARSCREVRRPLSNVRLKGRDEKRLLRYSANPRHKDWAYRGPFGQAGRAGLR